MGHNPQLIPGTHSLLGGQGRGVSEKSPNFFRSTQESNPGSLGCEPSVLPLHHEAIRKLKLGKAPGTDDITTDAQIWRRNSCGLDDVDIQPIVGTKYGARRLEEGHHCAVIQRKRQERGV